MWLALPIRERLSAAPRIYKPPPRARRGHQASKCLPFQGRPAPFSTARKRASTHTRHTGEAWQAKHPPPHFPPSLFPPDHRLSFPKCNTGALITRALTRRQQNNFKGLLEDSCPGSNFNMPLNRGDKIAIHVNCLPGLGGEMALWTRVLGGAGSRARMRRFAGKQRAYR